MGKSPRNASPSLRAQAIRLLARREHSRAELAVKLARKQAEKMADCASAMTGGHEGPGIDEVLDQLEQLGLLSDDRAAQSYVRSHARRFGRARLLHDLRSRGIPEAMIESSLAQVGLGDERQRARAVWEAKFDAAPVDAREWAKQARFLQGRGFSVEVIRSVLKDVAKGREEYDE